MIELLEKILDFIAPVAIITLEIIGIIIISYGSISALYNFAKNNFDLREKRTKIILG